MAPDRERAKRVIFEVVRQNGGAVTRARLPTIFWLAHLFYTRKARGFLTDWPIIRTPSGAGIDCADCLIDEMVLAGNVTRSHATMGPFTETACRLSDRPLTGELAPEAAAAIGEALLFVNQHPAMSGSDLAERYSRSWQDSPDGAELDIYSDLIPDDVYEQRGRELEEAKKAYENLFS
jgi:hypothetical protein